MDEPIDVAYFNWLCAKVKENSGPNHRALFQIMYETEFVWDPSVPQVAGDRNRAADGKELRLHFCDEMYVKRDQSWLRQPCSIFEMLIAFANHANFQTDIPMFDWFWEFMTNLRLDEFRRVTGSDEAKIHDILYAFVWRLYDENGYGGLFPLRRTNKDQRKVELWYQFFEYLDEKVPI
jgi:hypothetical protein